MDDDHPSAEDDPAEPDDDTPAEPDDDLRWVPVADRRPGVPDSPSGHELESVPWGPVDGRLVLDDSVEIQLATVVRRVVARVANYLLWGVIISVLFSIFVSRPDPEGPVTFNRVALAAVAVLSPMIIDTLLTATYGFDLGKLLLGMRVVDSHGRPPGIRESAVRTVVLEVMQIVALIPWIIGAAASFLAIPWAIVLIVSMVRDPRSQGFQDRAAGTFVQRLDRSATVSGDRSPFPDVG